MIRITDWLDPKKFMVRYRVDTKLVVELTYDRVKVYSNGKLTKDIVLPPFKYVMVGDDFIGFEDGISEIGWGPIDWDYDEPQIKLQKITPKGLFKYVLTLWITNGGSHTLDVFYNGKKMVSLGIGETKTVDFEVTRIPWIPITIGLAIGGIAGYFIYRKLRKR